MEPEKFAGTERLFDSDLYVSVERTDIVRSLYSFCLSDNEHRYSSYLLVVTND